MAPADRNFDLPATVREVAEVLGRRRALELAGMVCPPADPEQRGDSTRGRQGCLYVPKSLASQRGPSRLVDLLGADDADRLIRAFGGEILWFGPCNGIVLRHRNNAIWRRLAEGARPVVVAAEFGVCERLVRNILRRNTDAELHTETQQSSAAQQPCRSYGE